MKKFAHDPTQLVFYEGSRAELIPLHAPDAVDQKRRPVGKAPAGKNWRRRPKLTIPQATDRMRAGVNVGVRLRATDLVIDVDPRNSLKGDDPLQRLEQQLGYTLSDRCPTVVTGSGGLHLYLSKPADATVRDTLEDLQGIEFKTIGRQVVAAGSVHPNGRTYRVDPLSPRMRDAPKAPQLLLDLVQRPERHQEAGEGSRTPEELAGMLAGLDATEFKEQSRWLGLMMACHQATGGEGRDEFIEWSTSDPEYVDDAWTIGRRWDSLDARRGGGVTERTLFKHLIDAGHHELVPRESAEDDFRGEPIDFVPPTDPLDDPLADIGDPAFLSAMNRLKKRDPRRFSEMRAEIKAAGTSVGQLDQALREQARRDRKAIVRGGERETSSLTASLDKEYSVVRRGGDVCVVSFDADGVPGYLSFDAFRKLFLNRTALVGEKPRSIADLWLSDRRRVTYHGLAFQPGGAEVIEDNRGRPLLNLWRGWGVAPRAGDWKLMRRHVLEVIAAGDRRVAGFVLKWCAWALQNPTERAGVALVLKGKEGTGKSLFVECLTDMFGHHAKTISDPKQLTGNFNAHFQACCLLFAEEAFWAGDKSAAGPLKNLITGKHLFIEPKGVDGFQAPNMVKLVMATNNDWAVPASMESRRFQVCGVSDRRMGDRAYFAALVEEVGGGGREAMMRDLLDMDLKGWRPLGNVVETAELQVQRELSMAPERQALLDLLEVGHLLPAGGRGFGWCVGEDLWVPSRALYEHMRSTTPQLRHASDTALGRAVGAWGLRKRRETHAIGWTFEPLSKMRERLFPGHAWPEGSPEEWVRDDEWARDEGEADRASV